AFWLFCALSFAFPLIAQSTARGDEWASDIRFASSECDTSVDADCPREYAIDCSSNCGPQCCGPVTCDYGYCFDCPLSDELSRRLAPVMKSMQAQGITYAPGLTQFYQGV